MRTLLILFFLICPSVAMATAFSVPESDKSLQYLGQIFGPMPGLPASSTVSVGMQL